MLKATAKRRKSKQQLKDELAQEERKQKEIIRKLAEYETMEQKVKEAEGVKVMKDNYQQFLSDLYDNGIIKQNIDGTFASVDDPLERESIKSKSKEKV